MKRIGDVWDEIVSMDNLKEAAKRAKSSRRDRCEVHAFEKSEDALLEELRCSLLDHSYHSSGYRIFQLKEHGKVRDIADLPLYPDRVLHWAIVLVLEDRMNAKLIDQTHASVNGRGAQSAIKVIMKGMKQPKIKYALKVDVKKFFPSIDKDILKEKLRRVLKDKDALWLLDTIIDDYRLPGIPIGNRTSPMLANLYLSEMDHHLKEECKCHCYTRYMDDVVILGNSKQWLHKIRTEMESELHKIGLKMKSNWQIIPLGEVGLDFVGYVIWKDHILIRRATKVRMKRAMREVKRNMDRNSGMPTMHDICCVRSYRGLLMWCNGRNLYHRYVEPVDRVISAELALKKGCNGAKWGVGRYVYA